MTDQEILNEVGRLEVQVLQLKDELREEKQLIDWLLSASDEKLNKIGEWNRENIKAAIKEDAEWWAMVRKEKHEHE